jgi:putative ABC transport system ATP-binding protein
VLEIRQLVKHFRIGQGEPIRAVDDLSLAIDPGELVALYGPSGSGKSTLLMLVASLLRPDSGSVILDGQNVTEFSEEQAARYRLHQLGLISQKAELLTGSRVIENAALKLWLSDGANAEARVRPLLCRLGLGDRLQQRSEQLSLGERQRLMVALALSADPRLVLADEPTGNLDSHQSQNVLGLLSEVCRESNIAMLLVTHDPQAAGFADRVLELRDGRLEAYQPVTSSRSES